VPFFFTSAPAVYGVRAIERSEKGIAAGGSERTNKVDEGRGGGLCSFARIARRAEGEGRRGMPAERLRPG
jgi:hypothetical protein